MVKNNETPPGLPNPYVGPRSFQIGERLYGRDAEAVKLRDLMLGDRILLLFGPSGAGKTSLVQAALIPLLEAENFFCLPQIRLNHEPPQETAQPGFNRFTFSTLVAVSEALPAEQRLSVGELAGFSLTDGLEKILRLEERSERPVLIFDQFEELLTIEPNDRETKLVFAQQLAAVLRNPLFSALFVLREDYLAALDPYLRPLPTRLERRMRLDLLSVAGALEAIRRPAELCGVYFEDDAAHRLVDDLRQVQVQLFDGSMATELGPVVEPVQLQIVCIRLWESRGQAERVDLNDLAMIGTADEALASYYTAVVEETAGERGASEREIREWVDRNLITASGLRGQVPLGMGNTAGLDNGVVQRLEARYLLRSEKRRGTTWFELAHDRLIEPVRRNNAAWFSSHLSLLQRQAAIWEEAGRASGILLSGPALEEAKAWAETHLSELTAAEAEYLKLSMEAGKRTNARPLGNQTLLAASLIINLILIIALLALLAR